jgi:spore germination protein GerM
LAVGVVAVLAVGVWAALVVFPRQWTASHPNVAAAIPPTPPPTPGRKIKARLFYVADDGTKLVSVERDVPFGEGTVEQARQIVEAQLAPAVEPFVSAVPAGTALRAIFATEGGDLFVDLTKEVASGHPGGSMNETLTVYTLVNVLTTNLPAVTAVQVLVEGKEVETLAGHIDLRRPLEKNLAWVQ